MDLRSMVPNLLSEFSTLSGRALDQVTGILQSVKVDVVVLAVPQLVLAT